MDEHNRDINALCRYLDGRSTEEVASNYVKWCKDNNIRPEQNKTFTRSFGRLLPAYLIKKVVSIGGVKINCYRLTKNV